MPKFKKGDKVFLAHPTYSGKSGKWNKEKQYTEWEVESASITEHVVESCGKKRLYLYNDSPYTGKSFDPDDWRLFSNKKDAIEALIKHGIEMKQKMRKPDEYRPNGLVGRYLFYITEWDLT